jgi:hypothetical protein
MVDSVDTYIDGFLEVSYFLAAVAELEERDNSKWQLKRQQHLH